MEWELPDELNMPTPRKIYKLPIFTKQLVWIFGALIFFWYSTGINYICNFFISYSYI